MPIRSDRHEQWAIFWCSLLQPLIGGEVPPEEAGEFLRELAGREQLFPNGRCKKPSRAALWRKWKQYRRRFRGTAPQAAQGSRATTPSEASGDRSSRGLKKGPAAPQRRSDQPVPAARASSQAPEIDAVPSPQESRGHTDQVGSLETEGSASLDPGSEQCSVGRRLRRRTVRTRRRPVRETHLSVFIDCHSRYVVEGRYYYRENLDVLIDSLLRAWADHGASDQLYVDQAKVYRAQALRAACAALGIKLLHRAVRDPPGGGVIERFIQTDQGQLESEVRAGEILTLDKLNQAFIAWLEISYHPRLHSETGESPRQRYEVGKILTREVNPQRAMQFFLQREMRRVNKTFSDVQLPCGFFRVNQDLRGDKVEVRYDPFQEIDRVLIYSLDGEYLDTGFRHQRQGQQGDADVTPRPSPKVQYNYLDLLIEKHQQAIDRQSSGINYEAVMAAADRRWPFSEFAKQLAEHVEPRRSLGVSCRRVGSASKSLPTFEIPQSVPAAQACAGTTAVDCGNRVSLTTPS